MNGSTFNPTAHLVKLKGKDYLEVVFRIQWLRADHPEAIISTRLEHLDWSTGYAVFHARAEIPGKGTAEGTGSETRANFPEGWLEKAETIAVGRALAMLGYGTAFALADFEEGRVADAPVATAAAPADLATPAQLAKLRALIRGLHKTEEDLAAMAGDRYGVPSPEQLTRTQVDELLEALKAKATNGGKGAGRG